jgi:O-antigen/teichoic acid export membrane protein
MPINLLSSGLSQSMLPTAARWLHDHGATRVLRRLLWFSCGVVLLALCYCAVMWGTREWIYAVILKKQFESRDQLLLLWCAIFLLTAFRDQIGHLLSVRLRFPQLGVLTLISATFSLALSYFAMLRLGVVGALIGLLLGECINVVGVLLLSHAEVRRPAPQPAP